ncbi:helix-turn-helix domain-containing protein [Micromonospora polyrhachis]|uniref:Transcriptional regulator with XRE-family HTH domain n=1 Tax=Micromonospora polyrhachis TaxID=1282883 RepID=A0A7W7SQX8_9ACTN|nr:helix-turn-helix transcriptional regulator [Micromonospora polyrhachis]MBB4959318.1 transcriptional regulator with XRE-family HTH domain [Micromonospora polyrhachis]
MTADLTAATGVPTATEPGDATAATEPGSATNAAEPGSATNAAPDRSVPPDALGDRIRALRHDRGLTQRQLAEPRYTRAFLAAIESGIRIPTEQALRHIAERLDVDPDDLRYGRPPGIAETLTTALVDGRRRLFQGAVDAAAQAATEAYELADRYALPELRCRAVYLSGEVALHRGETATAVAEFDRALELLPPGRPELRAALVSRQAYCRFYSGESMPAVALLEDELRAVRAEPVTDPDAEVRLLTMLMYVFLELDWRNRARQLEREALPLLPRVCNPEWVARFYSTAAQLRQVGSELVHSEQMLDRAARLYTELGLTRQIGICHWARGFVLRRVGRPVDAAVEFERARTLLREVGAIQDYAGATLEMAEARRLAGAQTEAAELASEAARICRSSHHVEGMAEADRLLGRLAAARGDTTDGERLFRRAANRYDRAGMTAELMVTCRELGELLLAANRTDEAMAVFRRGLLMAERLP